MDGWIQTYTGRRVFPLAPRVEDLVVEDMAHALAQTVRFCGHLAEPYTVAQHSVYVAYLVPPRLALKGLFHDGSEAYLNDVGRPLKHSGQMGGYLAAEDALQAAIYQGVGCAVKDPDGYVKRADEMMLRVEAETWFPQRVEDWAARFPPLVVPSWFARHGLASPKAMSCWGFKDAKARFLEAYRALYKEAAWQT